MKEIWNNSQIRGGIRLTGQDNIVQCRKPIFKSSLCLIQCVSLKCVLRCSGAHNQPSKHMSISVESCSALHGKWELPELESKNDLSFPTIHTINLQPFSSPNPHLFQMHHFQEDRRIKPLSRTLLISHQDSIPQQKFLTQIPDLMSQMPSDLNARVPSSPPVHTFI